MPWLLLIIAGVFEIVWAVGLKQTEGFTRLWPSVITLAAMLLSFGCLALALKAIPIGNAYAIWTGIGAVGVAIVGIVWFGESADLKRLACIALIVLGIAGLKLLSPESPT
ncbi:quaternary ammonium compound efflux SMR transporter SugE [Simiduia sp. 21SJ11W-1]|uniref:quaternary ammonium compound efflux SMR transporter SugE n=1 Tax=Simiduia sp. 21SJ11W-1 TaxID=2909669 RepID=UPI00209E1C0F|nr:quaternary ammonium compound efflux SMR transporter SugE [Simiduia sp. 21SJ11W-1]UTA47594.1 quaternary ammonium compound efflux SMR transporter SugE [Simiduia sp. 21SJ11W-1]